MPVKPLTIVIRCCAPTLDEWHGWSPRERQVRENAYREFYVLDWRNGIPRFRRLKFPFYERLHP